MRGSRCLPSLSSIASTEVGIVDCCAVLCCAALCCAALCRAVGGSLHWCSALPLCVLGRPLPLYPPFVSCSRAFLAAQLQPVTTPAFTLIIAASESTRQAPQTCGHINI